MLAALDIPHTAALCILHCAPQVFDIETGSHTTVHDANPQGWDSVVESEQVRRERWHWTVGCTCGMTLAVPQQVSQCVAAGAPALLTAATRAFPCLRLQAGQWVTFMGLDVIKPGVLSAN